MASIIDDDNTPRVLDLTPTNFSLLTHADAFTFASLFPCQYLLEHCLPESEAPGAVVDTHIYNLRKNSKPRSFRRAG